MVRKAQERLYTDKATVTVYDNSLVDRYGKIRQEPVETYVVPCRLSYKNVVSASTGNMPTFSQAVTLFTLPDITIVEGSTIDVTRNGQVFHYKLAGPPAIYASHQEIPLERRDEHG